MRSQRRSEARRVCFPAALELGGKGKRNVFVGSSCMSKKSKPVVAFAAWHKRKARRFAFDKKVQRSVPSPPHVCRCTSETWTFWLEGGPSSFPVVPSGTFKKLDLVGQTLDKVSNTSTVYGKERKCIQRKDKNVTPPIQKIEASELVCPTVLYGKL